MAQTKKRGHSHSHSTGGFLLDEIAYSCPRPGVSPILKIFVSLYSLIVCLAAERLLVSLLILLSMLVVLHFGYKIRWGTLGKLFSIPLGFIFLGGVVILFEVTTKDTGLLFGIPFGRFFLGITGDSFSRFYHVLLQCLTAVSCMYYLSATTPMTELFTALRRLHLPGFLVEIMELVYRYIFVLLSIAGQIHNAQACRLGYGSLKAGFRSMGQLIANLFLRAYAQAERTYVAMESRGYTGEVKTLGIPYQTKPWHILVAIAYGIGITGLAVWERNL